MNSPWAHQLSDYQRAVHSTASVAPKTVSRESQPRQVMCILKCFSVDKRAGAATCTTLLTEKLPLLQAPPSASTQRSETLAQTAVTQRRSAERQHLAAAKRRSLPACTLRRRSNARVRPCALRQAQCNLQYVGKLAASENLYRD
jgi:hypothetical protein